MKDRQAAGGGPDAAAALSEGPGRGGSAALEASYAHAARLTRAEARNFYYAFRFLPATRRRGIFTVYAFSRRADDAVDAVEERGASEETARRELEHLRSLLGDAPSGDPLALALRDTIARHGVPRDAFLELLAGMEMDLVKKSYRTFDELYLYCYRAASVVGLACIEIFGYTGPSPREPAVKLGIAMQLTNILRDVAEDLERGRIYLPLEDMDRFGYCPDDLRARRVDDRFRALMRHEVRRAREYFREAAPLFPVILPESRHCPILLMRFYSRILDRIERAGYDVLRSRPGLPWHEKVWIAGSAWAGKLLTSRTT